MCSIVVFLSPSELFASELISSSEEDEETDISSEDGEEADDSSDS
jgi:hypothetical protein